MSANGLLLKIKRAETPFYARLKRLIQKAVRFEVPNVPAFWPLLRGVAFFIGTIIHVSRRLVVIFYRSPLFRTYCVSCGSGLYLEQTPQVHGHTRITVGEQVYISGSLVIASSHVLDTPELIIGDRVFLGHQVIINASKRVTIENDVLVAAGCYIADNDGHPKDPSQRAKGQAAPANSLRPIRICRNAWIGRNAHILKGVTIGECAIVGAGSVVVRDVPPFCIVAGNPASIIARVD